MFDTDFRVVAVGPEYLRLTNNRSDAVLGKLFLNTITEPNQKRHAAATESMRTAFAQVLKTKQVVKLPENRLDILPNNGGDPIEKWWRTAFIPVLNERREVEYIVMRTEDISPEMIALRAVNAQRRSNYILYACVIAAVAIIAWAITDLVNRNQQERISSVRMNCIDQDSRNQNTINKIKASLPEELKPAKVKATQTELAAIGIKAPTAAIRRFDILSFQQNAAVTAGLIDTLAPYRNCTVVVRRAEGLPTKPTKKSTTVKGQ